MSCGVLKSEMFLGADGTVCPCMSMVDAKAESWPNAFETPLRDILGEIPFMDRCATSVGMVHDGNDACRACEYIDRCNGGCRAGALVSSGNYLAPCPENCHFFFWRLVRTLPGGGPARARAILGCSSRAVGAVWARIFW